MCCHFRCPELVAMLSNINKHAAYITSTVGYMKDQIRAHPEILRTGQVSEQLTFTSLIDNIYLSLVI